MRFLPQGTSATPFLKMGEYSMNQRIKKVNRGFLYFRQFSFYIIVLG
ncbi:hypothetical protein TREPR_1934 [Treponema primitia ZAS-2]|uniref:Uncharacterized protein n=1 Tax=Treponema primitia (strain ATCC BAA-887 / DSM 12427 / ZAS-2) TaxID=545694 RepID=F5YKK0_TREPZ|nr:hypothetical protein TREPR_1934 [Treponema primitia ZAS-2]